MGGRRPRSVSEVVGRVAPAQRGAFTKALTEKDPSAVATASAKLVAEGSKADDIIYYASKLAGFVEQVVKSNQDLSYAERERLARQEWSRIKESEGLVDDPIVTQALVTAVAGALKKRKA